MDNSTLNTIPNQPQERWLPIEEFPGYEVSDHGRVRSYWQRGGKGQPWSITILPQRILSPCFVGKYPGVSLSGQTRNIHTLVLVTFTGPPPPGHECCHGDGDRTNNYLSNLRWGTHSDNKFDRVKHGNSPNHKGVNHPNAKLTNDQVLHIRELRSQGYRLAEIGKMFNIASNTVSYIARRILWPHVR